MERLPVYILAGGTSRRFGRDKARIDVDGAPMLERVADSLRPVASRVVVVAGQADAYADLGFLTIADRRPGLGPIGGIQAALAHARDGWILCSTCDRLGLETAWLMRLMDHRREGAEAVAFRSRYWEPFPALYHTRMRRRIDAAISDGDLTPWHLFDPVRTAVLSLPATWDKSRDINDMDALRAHLGAVDTARIRH